MLVYQCMIMLYHRRFDWVHQFFHTTSIASTSDENVMISISYEILRDVM